MADDRKVVLRLDLKPGSTEPLINGISKAVQATQSKLQDIFKIDRPLSMSPLQGMSKGMSFRPELTTAAKYLPTGQLFPAEPAPVSAPKPSDDWMKDLKFAARLGGAGAIASSVGRSFGGGTGQGFANTGGGGIAALGGAVTSGAAGFAAGGPIGAAVALIPSAVQAIKDFAEAPFQRITTGLNAISAGMRDLGGELGAGGMVLGGMSSLARLTPLVGDAMGGMIDAFKGFLGTGVSMAGLFSPGTMERFKIVQQDTMAAIGRSFVPIVEKLTDFTKLVGDFLATVLPGMQEMRSLLAPLDDVFAGLRNTLRDLAPTLKNTLIDAVGKLPPLFAQLGEALKDMAPLLGPAIELMTMQLEKMRLELGQRAAYELTMARKQFQLETNPTPRQQIGLGLLGPGAQMFPGAAGHIFDPIARMMDSIGEKLGLRDPNKERNEYNARFAEQKRSPVDSLKDSAAMAARNVSFSSSSEDVTHQVYQSIYKNAGMDKQQDQWPTLFQYLKQVVGLMTGDQGSKGPGAPGFVQPALNWLGDAARLAIQNAR